MRKYPVADEGPTYSVIYTRLCIKRAYEVFVSSRGIDRPFERTIRMTVANPTRSLARQQSFLTRAIFRRRALHAK